MCIRLIILTIWASCLLLSTSVGLVQAADKIIFSLNWIPYGLHFGVYSAVEVGYYRDANLDVDVLRGYGSGDTAKRVASGKSDFGMADAATCILSRAKGLTVKQIATILARSSDVVYFLKGSGISQPKDLENRTLGARAGETPLTVFPAFAAGAGFDAKKVKWVNMPQTSKIPSLMSKTVDSIITFTTEEPTVKHVAEKAGLEVRRFLYSDYGVDYYSIGIITTERMIRERPNLVRRFVDATIRGYAWAIDNPERAADAFVKHHAASNRSLMLEQWKVIITHMVTPIAKKKGLAYIDQDKMARTLDLIKRFYTLERDVSIKDIFTMKFLPPIFAKTM